MKALLSWFVGPIAGPVLGAACVALALGIGAQWLVMNTRIADLRDAKQAVDDQLATTNERMGICQANYRTIEVALNRQGADIRDLSAKSDAARAEAQRRLAEIAKQTTAAREASQRVLALPRPSPDMACEAAARLLRGAM